MEKKKTRLWMVEFFINILPEWRRTYLFFFIRFSKVLENYSFSKWNSCSTSDDNWLLYENAAKKLEKNIVLSYNAKLRVWREFYDSRYFGSSFYNGKRFFFQFSGRFQLRAPNRKLLRKSVKTFQIKYRSNSIAIRYRNLTHDEIVRDVYF